MGSPRTSPRQPKASKHRPKRRSPQAGTRSTAIVAAPTVAENIEKVLLEGNLTPLNADDRLRYYKAVCMSLGLNPLTKPFAYIQLNGKLTLYALRDCTEQLRKLHGVSVTKSTRSTENDLAVVEVEVRNREGRTDTGTGAVPIFNLKGEALANALMKAETKAKRRATLSICGLGFLDESELDTMRGSYQMVTPGGRIVDEQNQISEHEQRYLDREREGLKKLNPAQREVVERKMAAAKVSQVPQEPAKSAAERAARPQETGSEPGKPPTGEPALFWIYHEASKTYTVDGPPELKKSLYHEVLKRFWDGGVKALVVRDDESFEQLKYELDRRKVPFHRLREPGE